jgi:hypothetical protein
LTDRGTRLTLLGIPNRSYLADLSFLCKSNLIFFMADRERCIFFSQQVVERLASGSHCKESREARDDAAI